MKKRLLYYSVTTKKNFCQYPAYHMMLNNLPKFFFFFSIKDKSLLPRNERKKASITIDIVFSNNIMANYARPTWNLLAGVV